MKDFQPIKFSAQACEKELEAFKALLDSKHDLSERGDILPFFKSHLHLSAFLGSYNPKLINYDLVAHEFNLFGDFACDLVVGDSKKKAFAFIEFEDGNSSSLFQTIGAKATPEWARRFEHGVSQLVDWFWKLDDQKQTVAFRSRFGENLLQCSGMLAIGRREAMDVREAHRLVWRAEKVIIDSFKVSCVTFDDVYDDLHFKLESFKALAAAS